MAAEKTRAFYRGARLRVKIGRIAGEEDIGECWFFSSYFLCFACREIVFFVRPLSISNVPTFSPF